MTSNEITTNSSINIKNINDIKDSFPLIKKNLDVNNNPYTHHTLESFSTLINSNATNNFQIKNENEFSAYPKEFDVYSINNNIINRPSRSKYFKHNDNNSIKSILLIGHIGSGKTTYSLNLVKNKGYIRISPDTEIFKNYGKIEKDFPKEDYDYLLKNNNDLFINKIKNLLHYNKKIVIDSDYINTKNDRDYIKNILKNSGLDFQYIYLKANRKTCDYNVYKRNKNLNEFSPNEITKEMLDKNFKEFQSPNIEEDENMIIIDNNIKNYNIPFKQIGLGFLFGFISKGLFNMVFKGKNVDYNNDLITNNKINYNKNADNFSNINVENIYDNLNIIENKNQDNNINNLNNKNFTKNNIELNNNNLTSKNNNITLNKNITENKNEKNNTINNDEIIVE